MSRERRENPMNHKRLFIPGPTEVRPENLAALAQPQVRWSETADRWLRAWAKALREALDEAKAR